MKNIKNYTLKLDNYDKVINLLSSNVQILNKVSRFQIAIDQLISNQKKLKSLQPQLNKDISATEKTKNKWRAELIDKNLPVLRIIQAFAFDKKKKNLKSQLKDFTSEDIQNSPDKKLIKSSKKIGRIASKYSGYKKLNDNKVNSTLNQHESKTIIKFKNEYGLKPEMIKNLKDTNVKFIESILLYQDKMKEKEKTAKKMKKIDKQTQKLFSNKIDRFAILFEKENKDFFNEYQKLREKPSTEDSTVDSKQEANPGKKMKVHEHAEMA